jgi:hypothetical protein
MVVIGLPAARLIACDLGCGVALEVTGPEIPGGDSRVVACEWTHDHYRARAALYRLIAVKARRIRLAAVYLTTSVPTMPATAWPGKVQTNG